jgi:putative colanic acid biosynthesis acetyltransferase WcaF
MNERLKTDLGSFDNSWYNPGASLLKRVIWYFMNAAFLNSAFPISGIKVFFLRIFGARIGKGVVIKPHVSIKYPWHLKIGDNVWIGEYSWHSNVCISQGALLLCGNHHYKRKGFDLIVGKITLEEGSWVGAKAIVCPGVTLKSHSMLTVGSVATRSLEAYSINQGNPAVKIKDRVIKES